MMEKVEYGNFASAKARYTCTKWSTALYGLMEQDQPMARIKCKNKREAVTARSTLLQTIKRKDLPVSLARRGDTVYLVKKDVQ